MSANMYEIIRDVGLEFRGQVRAVEKHWEVSGNNGSG